MLDLIIKEIKFKTHLCDAHLAVMVINEKHIPNISGKNKPNIGLLYTSFMIFIHLQKNKCVLSNSQI